MDKGHKAEGEFYENRKKTSQYFTMRHNGSKYLAGRGICFAAGEYIR